MNIVNQTFLSKTFPPLQYAFVSDYIVRAARFRRIRRKKQIKPHADIILVCKDIDEWHKENYKLNKSHYPLIAKISLKLVSYFQRNGAKIHFNNFKTEDNKLIRYGIVSVKDFTDDLYHWNNFTVSSYMQKPFNVILHNPKIKKYQDKNLKSTVAFSILSNLNDAHRECVIGEKEFYDTIMRLPKLQNSYLKLFDEQQDKYIIEDILPEFRKMYIPIVEELRSEPYSHDYIKFENGNFIVKNNEKAKKKLMDHLNILPGHDRYRNLKNTPEELIAGKRDLRYHYEIRKKTMARFSAIQFRNGLRAVADDILQKHKQTKVFLLMMSPYFFIAYLLFKFVMKGLFIFIVYKKSYEYLFIISGTLHIPFLSHKE